MFTPKYAQVYRWKALRLVSQNRIDYFTALHSKSLEDIVRIYETEKKGGTGLTTEDVKEGPIIDIKTEPPPSISGKGVKRRSLPPDDDENQAGSIHTIEQTGH